MADELLLVGLAGVYLLIGLTVWAIYALRKDLGQNWLWAPVLMFLWPKFLVEALREHVKGKRRSAPRA